MGQNRFIVLGLFVILAMGMLFYLAFKVESFTLQRGTEVTVLFDDATGLKKGGDVKIKGVNFGRISGLGYQDGKAVVKIRLTGDVQIPSDVSARIRPESLLGENFLELGIPDGSTAAPIQSGDVITHATKAVDINEFVDRMAVFIAGFEEDDFVRNLSDVVQTLADNRERIDAMIRNLDQLAGDALAFMETNRESLDKTIHNLERITVSFGKNAPETARSLERVMARLDKLTADLERKSPNLAADLGETMRHLSEASEALPATLKEFDLLSRRVRTTLTHVDRFLLQEVPDIKSILEQRGIKAKVRIW